MESQGNKGETAFQGEKEGKSYRNQERGDRKTKMY
jgi:hypothetical protein